MTKNNGGLTKKSQRVSLAEDTIKSIDAIASKLGTQQGRYRRELEGWLKSQIRLETIVEKNGQSQEAESLAEVAEVNIDRLREAADVIDKELARLFNLRNRAEHAQGTFEVFEDTRYLIEKSGIGNTLSSPDAEIQEIRRAVFNLEGHKELLA